MTAACERTLTIDERTILVTPIKIRELPAFVRALEPIFGALAVGDLAGTLVHNAEALIEAVRIGARIDRAWLDERDCDALLALAEAVIEVNADFFIRRLLPRLEAAAETIGKLSSLPASTS